MSANCHYKTLGISKTATVDEVKAAFRKLSLNCHPDVAEGGATHQNVEAFKRISEAHSVLSSPTKRIQYDRKMQEASMWRPNHPRGYDGGAYGGGGFRRPPNNFSGGSGSSSSGISLKSMLHPRYMLFLGVGFASVFMIGSSHLSGSNSSDRRRLGSSTDMVEAWLNPATGNYEQPAPWDPAYRKLNPTLQLVPREQVKRRHI